MNAPPALADCTAVYATPAGAPQPWLQLDFAADGALLALVWAALPPPGAESLQGPWAERLAAYFDGSLRDFNAGVSPCGTVFQQRVWQAIAAIPYGQVASYGEIARMVGSAPRAVGQACARNPWPIVVPCHRVLSRTGLGGFSAGFGGGEAEGNLAIKRWLLQHEGATW